MVEHPAAAASTQIWRMDRREGLPIVCRIGLVHLPGGCPRAEKRRHLDALQARLWSGISAACGPGGSIAASRSYADDDAICAVAGRTVQDRRPLAIGIDIEQDPGPERFGDDELRSVGQTIGLAPGRRSPRPAFFRTWTELEARGKALGTGISLPADETLRLSRHHLVVDLGPLWGGGCAPRHTASLYGALCLATAGADGGAWFDEAPGFHAVPGEGSRPLGERAEDSRQQDGILRFHQTSR